jgi:rod shape-determining protein MreD
MRRAVLSAILVAVALLLQLTFVNQLRLPGGGGSPDLVLLTVVALGLVTSPLGGAVTGFCAGLALDLAPPGSYLIGEYALVFCVIGYLCGRIRSVLPESAAIIAAAAMAAAAVGEALSAAVGRVISAPQVTWAAVQHVLPSSVIYDVVLTPFLLYAVIRAVRWADGLFGAPADGGVLLARARPALGTRPGATVLGGAGLLGGAGWVSGPQRNRGLAGRAGRGAGAARHPRSPRLRSAASRPSDGWIGGGQRSGLRQPPPRPAYRGQPPRLRLGSGHRPGHIAAHPGSAAARTARTRPRSQPDLRLGARRRRDGTIGRSFGPAGGPPLRGRAGSGPPGSAFRGPRPTAVGHAGLAGSRPPARSIRNRRFRPDRRLHGGSASGMAAGSGTAWRKRRPVSLRLSSSRRRRRSAVGGGAMGSHGSGLASARPVSLRLGSPRRRDGMLAGLAPRRRLWARRQAAPRFRSGPSPGRGLLLQLAGLLWPLRRRRARFGSRRRSLTGAWTGGRLGGRSTVWRIGTRRTGGL